MNSDDCVDRRPRAHLHLDRIPLARRVEHKRLALAYGETAFTEARWTEVKLPCSLRYCGRPCQFFASLCPGRSWPPCSGLLAGRHKEYPSVPGPRNPCQPSSGRCRSPWSVGPLTQILGRGAEGRLLPGRGRRGSEWPASFARSSRLVNRRIQVAPVQGPGHVHPRRERGSSGTD